MPPRWGLPEERGPEFLGRCPRLLHSAPLGLPSESRGRPRMLLSSRSQTLFGNAILRNSVSRAGNETEFPGGRSQTAFGNEREVSLGIVRRWPAMLLVSQRFNRVHQRR